jgi:UDP-N-acetylmuramate-alanine ligase
LRYAHQRIWAVFEPRSNTTRRNVFQKELAESFREADAVLVSQIARLELLKPEERLDPQRLMQRPPSRRENRRVSAGCRCHRAALEAGGGGRGRDLRFQQRRLWRHPRKTAGLIGGA